MFINYDFSFLASIHISIVITFFVVNSCSKIETQYKSSFAYIIQVIYTVAKFASENKQQNKSHLGNEIR